MPDANLYIPIYGKLEKKCLKEMVRRALLFHKRFYYQISVLKGRFVRSMLREVTLRKILCDLNSRIDSL